MREKSKNRRYFIKVMREVTIQNVSVVTDVQVTIGSTDINHTELPMDRQKNILPKGSTKRISLDVGGGCAMLFVWNNRREIWKGIIPIGNDQPLEVDPDTPRVTYGLIVIPEHSGRVTREYFSTTEIAKPKSTFMVLILAIVGIIGLSLLIWYFARRYNSSRS